MHSLLQRALEIDPDYVPALEWMVPATMGRHFEGLIGDEEYVRLDNEFRRRI